MFSKEQIEKTLTHYNVMLTAQPKQIEAALFQAQWSKEDVAAALSVLQVHNSRNTTQDIMNSLFRDDTRLNPSSIQALLNIDTSLTPTDLPAGNSARRTSSQFLQYIEIIVIAIVFSLIIFVGGMWLFEFGLFHPTNML